MITYFYWANVLLLAVLVVAGVGWRLRSEVRELSALSGFSLRAS
ncbi:MAG: hypothetical protein QF570_21825 [Myxococcota bacterium]|jgi:hypothetical protein|nr:hypothetical protein [Myxococcota bacterium]